MKKNDQKDFIQNPWPGYIELALSSVTLASFVMHEGHFYRLLQDFAGMKKGETVTLTLPDPDPTDYTRERGHGGPYLFLRPKGKPCEVDVATMNEHVDTLQLIFEAVFKIPTNTPAATKKIAEELQDRSQNISENAALQIRPNMKRLDVVFPILLKQAMGYDSENQIWKAFTRLGEDSRTFLESKNAQQIADTFGHGQRVLHHLLTRSGSTKHLRLYYRMLDDSDTKTVRRAIRYIAQLGIPKSVSRLVELSDHPDIKVRADARAAIGAIENRS